MSRLLTNTLLRTTPTRLLSSKPPAAVSSSLLLLPKASALPSTTTTTRPFHITAPKHQATAATATTTTTVLPEFSLRDKVIVVTGAGRGLGLVQSQALLEAGATVYALDRLPTPDAAFTRIASEAGSGGRLHYRSIDVRDNARLNETIAQIAADTGRLDGLLACAGIQQETPALEYTMEDADRMFGVNITGVFMTAQAVARQMRKLERPGSMVFIASMSGTVANKGLICP